MSITVLISTYNGARKLPGILDSLKAQSVADFELIVVVDGSMDDTKEVLNNYLGSFHDFKIFWQENKGRAAVRNRGAKEAAGNLLIFFDDDMRAADDCIEQHCLHHLKFPQSLCSGAQIDDKAKALNAFQEYKSYLSNKWAQPLLKFDGQALPPNLLHLTAANFSVDKNVFLELGGFDERLTDAEDFDLAVRAMNAGIPVYYNHKAFAWHDDFVTAKSYITRLRQYQEAQRRLRAIKPEIYGNVPLRAPIKINAFKAFAFSLFVSSTLLNIIDKKPKYLNFLPKKLTYRMFDLITTAYGVVFTGKSLN